MLSEHIIQQVLERAVSTGGDFAELFVEDTLSNGVSMIDGAVEAVNTARIYGAGIRVLKGVKSVYASTSDVTLQGLLAAAESAAAAIAVSDAWQGSITLTPKAAPDRHPVVEYPGQVPVRRKVELIRAAYDSMKSYSPEIVQAVASLSDKDQQVLIANTEGLLTRDRRVRTRLAAQAIASDGKENQVGFEGPGRLAGYEIFEREIDPAAYGRTAAKQAVTMLHADYCPAGQMMVAIENGFGGVLFHEACGHSLEAEAVAKGHSEFAGKLGQQVASTKVTAIDDGTPANLWGSINIDDEGTPGQKNVLIENGILTGYLVDRLNGRRMGLPSTGSARRESYLYAPTSRMTNTYIANGEDDNEEIIRSMERGLYAKKMGGGQVHPATGEFNFAVAEGYLVENGVITRPVRGAMLIGTGSQVLLDIDRVGKNLDFGQGMCGASSGSVPTNVGQPLIRIKQLTVGGR